MSALVVAPLWRPPVPLVVAIPRVVVPLCELTEAYRIPARPPA